jgi:hypothetical protein
MFDKRSRVDNASAFPGLSFRVAGLGSGEAGLILEARPIANSFRYHALMLPICSETRADRLTFPII